MSQRLGAIIPPGVLEDGVFTLGGEVGMNKIPESIFDGDRVIIPMARVSFIEKRPEDKIAIIMESSQMDEDGYYDKEIVLDKQAEDFLDAWCQYRYEVEGSENFAKPE